MSVSWPAEVIPDEDTLYMRAHKSHISDGELQPGVFCDKPKVNGAMSTNWKRYCETAAHARALAKTPEDNGIISFITRDVRAVPLVVNHTPDHDRGDRSHADVVGKKTTKVRARLLKSFEWCIRLGE